MEENNSHATTDDTQWLTDALHENLLSYAWELIFGIIFIVALFVCYKNFKQSSSKTHKILSNGFLVLFLSAIIPNIFALIYTFSFGDDDALAIDIILGLANFGFFIGLFFLVKASRLAKQQTGKP